MNRIKRLFSTKSPINQYTDYRTWLFYVECNGLYLQFVPENLLDFRMCLVGVRQNGLALEYVPRDMRCTAICGAALRNNEGAIKFIPHKIKILIGARYRYDFG